MAGVGWILFVLLGVPVGAAADEAAQNYASFCASCHGPKGKGDGVSGAALPVKPTSFADPKFWKGKTDAALKKVIKEGGAANGMSATMAPWGGILNDDQIDAMVAYLKTLKKK